MRCTPQAKSDIYDCLEYINVIQTGLYFACLAYFFILLFCMSILYVYSVTVSLCI